jgi:hypothetical protein
LPYQKKRGKKMTKRNLLLSLILVLGLVVVAPSAMAQLTQTTQWTPGASYGLYGRVEGNTEATGPVTLAMSGITGGTVGAGNEFLITYSLPVADAPGSITVECTGNSASIGNGASPFANGCASYLVAPYLLTGSKNTVVIAFANPTTFNGGDGSTIKVVVRVPASKLAPGGAFVTASIASSGPNISLTNNVTAEDVLWVHTAGLTISPVSADDVLTCIGSKDVGGYGQNFAVNVAENFVQALTSISAEYALDPDLGVVPGSSPSSPGSWSTDITNGSNFTITFSGVPAGVGIKFVKDVPCSQWPTTAKGYCAGGTLAVALDPNSPNPVTSATGGVISFTFDVTSDDAGVTPESVNFYFKLWSDGPVAPGTATAITATVSYAPNPPTSDIPNFVPTAEPTSATVVNFYDCVTNLLFPFVTNLMAGGGTAWNNLGTELFVANTTADPFNTTGAKLASPLEVAGAAVPQSGACTFWLFPNKDNKWDGLAGAVAAWTSPTVQPGATIGFDLGSIPAFAGMTGYVFAQCDFQNAHGVEYVDDNYGLGEPGYAAAFDAIVIPTVELYHRSPAGDGLGETAIAPIAVDKMVQKLLSGGIHNAAGVGGGMPR